MKSNFFTKVKLFGSALMIVFVSVFCNACSNTNSTQDDIKAITNIINKAGMIYNKKINNSNSRNTNLSIVNFRSTTKTDVYDISLTEVHIKVFDTIFLYNNYQKDFDNYENKSSNLGLILGSSYNNLLNNSDIKERNLTIYFSQIFCFINAKTSTIIKTSNIDFTYFEFDYYIINTNQISSNTSQDTKILAEFKSVEALL